MWQVPNGLTPANGETRYTFNQMNRLIQVETHNGSSYQVQAEVAYDGDGHHLQAVAYTGGEAITTTFAFFGNGRSPGAYLDTFTHDYHGRINSHSRVSNGRTYAMTVNEFDELDRPLGTAYEVVVLAAGVGGETAVSTVKPVL